MQEDDVSPNDGTYFMPREPEEQVIERQKERAKTLEAADELKRIIDHFEDDIKATDSVQKTLELAEKYGISKADALIIMDIVRQQLEAKQATLQELLDIHTHKGGS